MSSLSNVMNRDPTLSLIGSEAVRGRGEAGSYWAMVVVFENAVVTYATMMRPLNVSVTKAHFLTRKDGSHQV